jgi:alcohol dehydrogenase class IV
VTATIDTTVRTFEFSAIDRVVHGIGALDELSSLVDAVSSWGVVVATTSSVLTTTDLVDRVRKILGDRPVTIARPIRAHTPESDVVALEASIRETGADCVVAIGGSSVSDGAKIAALRAGGGTPRTVAVDGVPAVSESGLTEKSIPFIMIPTTLSVGEFNGGGGMVAEGSTSKTIVLDERAIPWAVVFDPTATLATPRELWLSSGVKAVDHAVETLWSASAHPYGDALASASLPRLMSSLTRTSLDPEDLGARLESQIAAWMSIATMRNTGIRLSHILEHSIGAYWGLGHGITSCVALPTIVDHLVGEIPEQVAVVARALGVGDSATSAEEIGHAGAEVLRSWIAQLGLPARLRDVVEDTSGFDVVAEQAVDELRFFGQEFSGGRDGIRLLLDRMW